MDRRLLACLCLAACFAAGSVIAAMPGEPEKSKIAWQTDLKAAHKVAVKQQKPMLVVFGAEWCVYCKKLESETLERPGMAEYVRKEFVPVHLDFDQSAEIAEVLDVKALPCTVILSPEADLLGRIDGYVKAADYQATLNKAQRLQARIRQAQYSGDSRVRR